jgi:hypothetical protein
MVSQSVSSLPLVGGARMRLFFIPDGCWETTLQLEWTFAAGFAGDSEGSCLKVETLDALLLLLLLFVRGLARVLRGGCLAPNLLLAGIHFSSTLPLGGGFGREAETQKAKRMRP